MKKLALLLLFVLLASAAHAQPGPPPSPWTISGNQVYTAPGRCVTVPQTVTGGCVGANTINATQIYEAGNRVATLSGNNAWTGTNTYNNTVAVNAAFTNTFNTPAVFKGTS